MEFNIEEVENAIKETTRFTSPGEDGISYSFLKSYWSIIKIEFWEAMKNFIETAKMNEDWKRTMIVLIPKINNPKYAYNYGPISLCNTVYKISSKVLLNRLNGIIPKLISLEQAAFLKGRSLQDHVLIDHELIHKFIFLKLPKLLSNAIMEKEEIGFRVSNNSPRISHLLYAEDISFFVEAKLKNFQELFYEKLRSFAETLSRTNLMKIMGCIMSAGKRCVNQLNKVAEEFIRAPKKWAL
ncbi:uncharacterized protein LOC110112117 [Dendrobium catenatum]|uniref:uncharacterized protein LOC110112117 n=1 Tax=Dendrobium catenatum TaxID=906689 RepID=UPI0009F6491E|nr:uncharacterized protein LOC110112117 [Dendrobium catenatum]